MIQGDKLKVTDFGFAKALSSSRQLTRTVIGTPLYMSPQILSKQPYSSKCDIWSIGVIFYELLIGRHPWSARSMPELYKAIMRSPQV
jgi:serine/threonine protein kinase